MRVEILTVAVAGVHEPHRWSMSSDQRISLGLGRS